MKEKKAMVLRIISMAGMTDASSIRLWLHYNEGIDIDAHDMETILHQLMQDGKIEKLTHPRWTCPMWIIPSEAAKVMAVKIQNLNREGA